MKIEILVKNGFPVLILNGVIVKYDEVSKRGGNCYVAVESETAKPFRKEEKLPETVQLDFSQLETKLETVAQAARPEATKPVVLEERPTRNLNAPGAAKPEPTAEDTLGTIEKRVLAYFRMNPGKTKNNCARDLGLIHETVSAVVEHLLRTQFMARGPGPRSKVYYTL